MTERPIIFSAPMVRALLAGTKTQTRRVLKAQPPAEATSAGNYASSAEGATNRWSWLSGDPRDCDTWEVLGDFTVPYRIGDCLWVRESWRTKSDAYNDLKPSEMSGEEPLLFEADGDGSQTKTTGRRRAAMHMPRWASRLILTVTDVRVERLNAISEADAQAEGVAQVGIETGQITANSTPIEIGSYTCGFADLWDSINGAGAWDANPWVVAVTFTVGSSQS